MNQNNNIIFIMCVFLVTGNIARGQQYYVDDLQQFYGDAPAGYHYETLDEILDNYDPDTYIIVPMSAGYPSAAGNRVADSVSSDDVDDEDELQLDRRKRGFFSFMSSDAEQTNDAELTSDAAAQAGNAERTSDAGQTNAATADGENVVGRKTDSGSDETADGSTAVTVQETASSSTTTSMLMSVVGIGQDVENSMVVAAPYLPMVCKVAMFVVPGLSQYQTLVLALNMATITSQAYRNYADGESLTSVAAKFTYQAMTLRKRDTSNTFTDYAHSMYDSFKDALASRFSYVPQMFSNNNDDSTDMDGMTTEVETVGLTDAESGVETVQTTVTRHYKNGVEITEHQTENTDVLGEGEIAAEDRETLDEDLFKFTEEISSETDSSASGSDSGSNENENDDEFDEEDDDCEDEEDEEEEEEEEEVKIDDSLFKQILNRSMSLQPSFIQNKSGEQLIAFLDRMKVNLPITATIDSRKIFDVLVSTMDFDDSVTDEQLSRLVDLLSKTTNYFISLAINAKPVTTEESQQNTN